MDAFPELLILFRGRRLKLGGGSDGREVGDNPTRSRKGALGLAPPREVATTGASLRAGCRARDFGLEFT